MATIENGKENSRKINSICVQEGKFLELHGVLKVEDFDKDEINLDTNLGPLTIKGRELHIAQLVLEEEQMTVEGEIRSVCFEEGKAKKQGGLLKRLTK